jgi:hypothetical protein
MEVKKMDYQKWFQKLSRFLTLLIVIWIIGIPFSTGAMLSFGSEFSFTYDVVSFGPFDIKINNELFDQTEYIVCVFIEMIIVFGYLALLITLHGLCKRLEKGEIFIRKNASSITNTGYLLLALSLLRSASNYLLSLALSSNSFSTQSASLEGVTFTHWLEFNVGLIAVSFVIISFGKVFRKNVPNVSE